VRSEVWPREESNLRARIRSPSLYPLSYGAVQRSVAAVIVGELRPQAAAEAGSARLRRFHSGTTSRRKLSAAGATFLGEVADGTRTHDHLDHNQGLYQLSYSHRALGQNSRPRRRHPDGKGKAKVDGMEIRRATEADLTVLRRLWNEFTAEATFTPYPGSGFEPSLVTKHIALVAEEGDSVVGTVYANTASQHFGYVFGLYIHPDARRRGIARALMRAIAGILRYEGRRYVVLSVDTPNDGARALYERLGFEDAARMLRADIDQLLDG
jgi:ribosomal protein S18 acetylase RimI-like enzyme